MADLILTGARAPVTLDLARACRAAGYDVHLADCVAAFAAREIGTDPWVVDIGTRGAFVEAA